MVTKKVFYRWKEGKHGSCTATPRNSSSFWTVENLSSSPFPKDKCKQEVLEGFVSILNQHLPKISITDTDNVKQTKQKLCISSPSLHCHQLTLNGQLQFVPLIMFFHSQDWSPYTVQYHKKYSWTSLPWPSWGQNKEAIVERLKQESMYGLSAKKTGRCGEVAVIGGSPVVERIW